MHEIWSYIAADNVRAADRVAAKIRSSLSNLARTPGLGHRRVDVNDPRYRFWKVYSYLIAYRYDDRELTVLRVVHGARNIRRLFKR